MYNAEFALLDPKAYYDPDWMAREQQSVLARRWSFVGFVEELANDGDYLTLNIADRSVVVRKFASAGSKGDLGLRAFRNVCSHRHSRLLAGECGNSRLRCSYHGWTYDDEGFPVGLPGNRTDFGLSMEERRDLALKPYQVSVCGAFVFVRLSDEKETLGEFLGENLCGTLEQLSRTFAVPFEKRVLRWNANWKAGVENTLEPYHTDFVHADSLAQVVTREHEFAFQGRHSSVSHGLTESSRAWWERMLRSTKLSPDPVIRDYHHYLIYPNVCIGVTNGTLLSVQSFHPVGPDRCELRYRLLLPKQASEPAGGAAQPMREALKTYLSEFNLKTIEEDRLPVESCQLGYPQAESRAVFARSEARVAAFQREIASDVNGANSMATKSY